MSPRRLDLRLAVFALAAGGCAPLVSGTFADPFRPEGMEQAFADVGFHTSNVNDTPLSEPSDNFVSRTGDITFAACPDGEIQCVTEAFTASGLTGEIRTRESTQLLSLVGTVESRVPGSNATCPLVLTTVIREPLPEGATRTWRFSLTCVELPE